MAKTYQPIAVGRLFFTTRVQPECPLGARNLLESIRRSSNIPQFHSTCSAITTDLLKDIVGNLSQCSKHTTRLTELSKLHQLVRLLLNQPQARSELWGTAGCVPVLIGLSRCGRDSIERQVRAALSLLGHAPPYTGRGLRILTIDGGGTRGIIPLIVLQRLETLTGLRSHQLFDYVCGTSTGAILANLLFVQRVGIEEATDMYRQFSMQVFKMNNLLGIGQLFLNHAFYDSKLLKNIIRMHHKSDMYLYETAMEREVPRISMVSTVVNQPVIQPFLFTNYCHRPDDSRDHAHYQSGCGFRLWEAVVASTAAPGYFEEVRLGPHVLQDGGLLTNNPTAVALHEARLLWGAKTPIQTVVSLGTGLYSIPPSTPTETINSNDDVSHRLLNQASPKNTSLREKLTKVVMSATDTESVHTILRDLLPDESYFRFNPRLKEEVMLDESKPEKLDLLVREAESYMEANENKTQEAATSLLLGKRPEQKAWEMMERGLNSLKIRTRSLYTDR